MDIFVHSMSPGHLGEAGFFVDLVDLANGANVSGSADVKAKIELLNKVELGFKQKRGAVSKT